MTEMKGELNKGLCRECRYVEKSQVERVPVNVQQFDDIKSKPNLTMVSSHRERRNEIFPV